jgi:hypothetical protein
MLENGIPKIFRSLRREVLVPKPSVAIVWRTLCALQPLAFGYSAELWMTTGTGYASCDPKGEYNKSGYYFLSHI